MQSMFAVKKDQMLLFQILLGSFLQPKLLQKRSACFDEFAISMYIVCFMLLGQMAADAGQNFCGFQKRRVIFSDAEDK